MVEQVKAKNSMCALLLGAALMLGPGFVGGSAALYAQAPAASASLVGTWQGTLTVPTGKKLRIVAKITRSDGDKLATTFYSIDQGGNGMKADTTSIQDGNVKIFIDRISMTYTGKMAADGNSIVGESNQGTPMPLVLERATSATEWAIPEAPKPTPPMDPKADPSFDIATIKPSKPDAPGKMFGVIPGGKFKTINLTVGELISVVYSVETKQVIGAPDWIWTEKYDIQAQSETPGQPSIPQLKSEVKKLLADRFQLKFHEDKKNMTALVMTVSKSGPKLKVSASDPDALPGFYFTGVGSMAISNAKMRGFADFLQTTMLDNPVVDQTGLTARYDFHLKWTPDDAQLAKMGMKAPATEAADAPPNLFTAMQEQLGLKLESGKVDVPVMVIDGIAKPSDN